jgi:hypothetical protein
MTRAVAPVRGGRVVRRAAASAIALLLVIAQTAAGVTWHDAVEVDSFSFARRKALAVTGTQRLHLLYAKPSGFPVGVRAIYRRSGDGGLTWKDPITLSPDNQLDVTPLAIKRFGQSTLDALWWNDIGNGLQELWYRRSVNNGFAWADAMNAAPGQFVVNGDVARFGDRVSIVYTDVVTASIDVRISTDGGATFGDPVSVGTTDDFNPVGDGQSTGGHPAIIDKNGTITVAWFTDYLLADMELVIRRSTNAGATWRDPQIIKGTYSGVERSPISLLGAGPLKIIIGYRIDEGGVRRAAARTSLNRGSTWRPEVRVGGAESYDPMFAYGGGLLRATYWSCVGPECANIDVKFKTSDDFGTTWSPSAIVNPGALEDVAPRGIGALGTGQTVVAYQVFKDGVTFIYSRTTAGP